MLTRPCCFRVLVEPAAPRPPPPEPVGWGEQASNVRTMPQDKALINHLQRRHFPMRPPVYTLHLIIQHGKAFTYRWQGLGGYLWEVHHGLGCNSMRLIAAVRLDCTISNPQDVDSSPYSRP